MITVTQWGPDGKTLIGSPKKPEEEIEKETETPTVIAEGLETLEKGDAEEKPEKPKAKRRRGVFSRSKKADKK